MLDGFLTQRETAAALGVTEQALRNWRKQGDGPPYKLRGLKFAIYPAEELVAWCEENNVAIVLPDSDAQAEQTG